MTTTANAGIYAPLKQGLTDSDSDEDKMHDLNPILSPDSSHNIDFNSGLHSSKNYSLSDMDEFNTNVNTVESTMDNLSFLQSDASNKMSFSRKCAFIASILACIFTVVIFLWGIPCSESIACPATNEWHDKTTSWELPYEEIELSGTVQVVDGAIPHTKNLIFIYRGNHMKHPDKDKKSDNVNGVLLIVGNSGKVGWYTREARIPTEINCHLIDVNKDKIKDCIVFGSEVLLAALNPLSGTYIWYKHKNYKGFKNIFAMDFPTAIKDLDGDGVNDLLTVATIYPRTTHNSLFIMSGSTGNVIGEPMSVDECQTVKIIPELAVITFTCKNNTVEAVRTIPYSLVYRRLLQLDKKLNHTPSASVMSKKVNQTLKKSFAGTREVYTNGPGNLIVENTGDCPDNCKVYLKLTLDRNNVTNTSWEYTAHHVYAMRPSSFVFANSIRGFVLKL